MTADSELKLNS